jgi:hypothetical protein
MSIDKEELEGVGRVIATYKFAYSRAVHSTTNMCPFEVVYGLLRSICYLYHCRNRLTWKPPSVRPMSRRFMERLKKQLRRGPSIMLHGPTNIARR